MSLESKNEFKVTDYKFSDLVDISAFSKILESFFKGTGIPNGLIGEEGEIISQAGWVNACAQFHRVNPESNKNCLESNFELMHELHDGEVSHSLCKNGLLDYATPIVIEEHRLATLFLGQVFNTSPNISIFQEQATKFGYDEEAYIEAIRSVPIISSEQMESLTECIVGMAQMLASSGLTKLRQDALEEDLHKSTKQRIKLEDILNFSPMAIGWSNLNGKIEYINHQFTELFGYTLEDIPDIDTYYRKVYPDEDYRKNVILPWYNAVISAYKNGTTPPEIEGNLTCKDGSQRHIVIRIAWIGELRLVNFSDMTAHWKSEQRNRAHDTMLEMVAKGLPLPEILNAIVQVIESEEPTSKCSILLLDDENHLHSGASSSLPKFYNEAIDGVEIGVGVGSCGTSAYLKKRVVVEDIMTHEYWKPYKELAQKADLRACWSEPIVSSSGKVLGTFAIYHTKPAKPTKIDFERISFAANLAAIAIENNKTHKKLEDQAYSDYLTGLANRRSFMKYSEAELSRISRYDRKLALIMFDIDHFKKVNDTYGHNIGDLVLKKISDICRKTLRDIDIIGRIGGEEFAVLLPETDLSKAMEVAERLRKEMMIQEIVVSPEASVKFTASFGVVAINHESITIDELLHQADTALYKAKESGRNQVCVFS